jgi:hypothetical protein
MIRQVEYFSKPGKGNTDACVSIVKKMVAEEGFAHVVVASTSGTVAAKFHDALKGTNAGLVIVTHSHGFKTPNQSEFDSDIRQKLESEGTKVLTTTILTHSLETALSAKYQGAYPTQVIAHSLRRFGEGTKVCCEIVMEATDSGAIPEAENVISIAGTGHGADSVCVIRSAVSKRFLELYVSELRAKPA